MSTPPDDHAASAEALYAAPTATSTTSRPVTVRTLQNMKTRKIPIAALTAYDFPTAHLLDASGVDLILVGDSANMVVHGEPDTLSITMATMLVHTRDVVRATERAMVVADMPFGSYQQGAQHALRNAIRFVKQGGATAIKLEGGMPVVESVRRLSEAGIAVMGHLGLTPQSIRRWGTYAVRGGSPEERAFILESAQALEKAGAFSIVLEKIPAELAAEVTTSIGIPTIGIGAGPSCDGQILVIYDILGYNEDFHPRFVRRYANFGEQVRDVGRRFVADVKSRDYPSGEESY